MAPSQSPCLRPRRPGPAPLVAAIPGLALGLSMVAALGARAEAWYPFRSVASTQPGVIGMQDWLEAPAGRHGRIVREGDQLLYHGKPIRLWGVNNTFAACAPPQELAERRAQFYAKYGVNSVRLHKYADGAGWAGILTREGFVEFDPVGLDRMDYYIAQLKSRGIYVKLSPTFGPPRLGRKDVAAVPFLEEFGDYDPGRGTIEVPHSGIFYSPDIQGVHIAQMVGLLRHTNAYTGLTYAQDPAIWDLEIINEQSSLSYTSPHALERSATLRAQVGARFSRWLEIQYGSQEEWVKAWGERAINSFDLARNESLAHGTVLPIGNPYFWNPTTLKGNEAHRRRRHLDTLEFLTHLQLEFYQRYVAAVRAAGYSGEISGSNWQAGRSYSHFANLWTDAQVGTIDRHNYFGGLDRNPRTGQREVSSASMLASAGSGILSTGMQQVAGLPFMISEWIHVWPSEWGIEGPAIIGAYGMGLQGWDVSYLFQNLDEGRFLARLGRQSWEASAPQVMGIFPAVARQVLRGDVATAIGRATLHVHAPSLFEGTGMDFEDEVAQGYDDKSFDTGKVGRRALAVTQVQVAFVDRPHPTPAFDIARHERDGALVSDTGQLRWHEAEPGVEQGGYFVIDTPGTQALVGFAQGRAARLADAEIASHSRFAAIYLTALDPTATLAHGKRVLISVMGRARNTGQRYSEDGSQLLEPGTEPVVLESIRATLRLKRQGTPMVRLLDHDGRLTEAMLPMSNGRVEIDTGRDRTPYYLLDYQTTANP